MLKDGQTVKVDFVGKLANGAEFSNSHLVGEPLRFTLGEGVMLGLGLLQIGNIVK